eukprot:4857269-Amphidinium_carterae.2
MKSSRTATDTSCRASFDIVFASFDEGMGVQLVFLHEDSGVKDTARITRLQRVSRLARLVRLLRLLKV